MSDERNLEAGTQTGVVARATETAQKVMQWFPVRVFQRFSVRNGDILAAGASYQAFFAIAAALYVAFAIVGIWLGASSTAIKGLISMINSYMPGLISADGTGLATPDAVQEVAADSAGSLTVTGIFALLAVIWTAIGWIGFVRKAVRDIFGLPPEQGNFFLLKARDLLAAIGFAILLLLGAVLSTIGSSTLNWVFEMIGFDDESWLLRTATQVLSIVVAFAVDVVTLVVLFRFLTGTDLKTKVILPGALLGGAGIAILQVGAGFLLGKAPSNPLLASFVVIIGLLLWFRLIMMVMLLSASWVAVTAEDNNIAMVTPTPEERELVEAKTLHDAALVKYREARIEKAGASWYARPGATRKVRHWAEHAEELRLRVADAEEALDKGARKATVPDRS